MDDRDRIFAESKKRADDFKFNREVASVFDDMLSRSVPFYDEIQRMVVELAGMFVKPNSAIYDIGCSTGTTIQLLAQKLSTIPGIRFVGVDGSPDMIQKAKKKLGKSGHLDKCEFVTADINSSFAITDPSVVLLILTLQFSRPLYRDAFVKRIHDSLQEGCCLILIEKVLCDNSFLNRVFIDLYYEFKKRMGYSELEISQKRESLENILIPYRESENMELLRRNGFRHIETFFRWYNFSGILAVK